MPSMLSTNGERAMERALGQARYPLWIYTKEEWEDWEKAFDCVEWDNYHIDHPNELEDWTEDEWGEYLEGLYPREIRPASRPRAGLAHCPLRVPAHEPNPPFPLVAPCQ
jgi:hypothetical protein